MSDLEVARGLARGALAALERSRQRIDDLNVYPVPDGDTGTNLSLTARAVVDALEASRARAREAIARDVSRSALMGARGNSGVILSQIVRGAAEVLGRAETVTPTVVAAALRAAAEEAYRAIREPVEGTMLTVIRELAEEAEIHVGSELPLTALLTRLVESGEEAVARTPDQLAILRRAGVVDAGGAGLLELVRGVAAVVTGEPLPEAAPTEHELSVEAIHQELSRFRYCTSFVVEGSDLRRERLELELAPLGDSLLIVGDASALKIHVHTDEPGAALQVGTRAGGVERVEVVNMHRQTLAREERLSAALEQATDEKACDVVAVVAGDGNRALFESLGAGRIVEGGQTMNPAAAEIVAAIEATTAPEVVVLPNNANVVLSAEQAARLAEKPVRVVHSHSLQAGLAAMVAYHPERSTDENAAEMHDALDAVATGAVTVASRDVELAGRAVANGWYLGLLEGEPVTGGEAFDDVAEEVVERLLAEPRDVLTLLTGAGAPSLDALLSALRQRYPDVEVAIHEGGQPHYPLLLAAE
jgi:uncharacterized protein